VVHIAEDLGYEVEIRELEVEELLSADEAFFTGTAVEVTPIREVDGTKIGSGSRGPVTRQIQEVFLQATRGGRPEYRDWLSPVVVPEAIPTI
jgi:branched-chain amino acid aminotransferase